MLSRITGLIALLCVAGGCANGDRPIMRADLESTEGYMARGSLTLMETDQGVRITGEITGLDPGSAHGFHVHEFGDCGAPDAVSAGEHFDPTQEVHGDPRTEHHHMGDMLNLEADAGGVAVVDQHIDDANLGIVSATSLRERAMIVHADPDDYVTDPDGNAGDRIACGVILDEVN